MKNSLYVQSLLDKKALPKYWNSKRCEPATNYKISDQLYIHKLELPENTLDFLCSLCRYGAAEEKKGSRMLWSPDFTWWVSENPKARAEGMQKPNWEQFPKTKLPPKTQLAKDIIKRDIVNAYQSPYETSI